MSKQPDSPPSEQIEFVAFTVAGLRYCMDIREIREIRSWTPVTQLPRSGPDVLGVMNLRGTVIAVFDLSMRFGTGPTEPSPRNVVIVASTADAQVGLLVESVSEVVSIPVSEIRETPDVKSDIVRDCIAGIVTIDDEMTRIVDLAAATSTADPVPA